jgi:hypothetical protein
MTANNGEDVGKTTDQWLFCPVIGGLFLQRHPSNYEDFLFKQGLISSGRLLGLIVKQPSDYGQKIGACVN